ncbi:carbohydrate kinase [uncultured Sphaerochaeta sp.]|uniref:carbohydrate kinase family protein n=1 Tax=uncultured Sphaerochaeta sp. TaxID=886478 RepID=UPI002A0A7E0E|nr:carbohydrate kinase [uncultured Sphaerochaeta sp.]
MIGVIGEALIDFIGISREERSYNFASFVGGCGLNAATAAARLGSSVSFFGKLSNDMFGVRILDHLVDNKILFDPELCNSFLPSMIGFAQLDDQGKAQYAFYSKNTASVCLTSEELCNSMSNHSNLKVLHIGSVSLAIKPGCDEILDAIDFYTPRPIVFLDPNVRPTVIEDFEAYRARLFKACKLADIIKLSDEDLLLLYPGLAVEEAAKTLCSEVSAHVILTRGKQGSTWFSPKKFSVNSPIIDLPVVDTVGAGDTFSGAILSFLHENNYFGQDGEDPVLHDLDREIIEKAMRYANAAASINCSRKGCNPPTQEEVEALVGSI